MCNDHSSPMVSNCTFSGNSAYVGGGMCNREYSSPTVTNCTFIGNSAGSGGGMTNYCYCDVTVTNCILWANTAPTGPEMYNCEYPPTVVTYSDIAGGWSGTGNIPHDPCFAVPGYWGNIYDPNIHVEPNDPNAIWVDGDYHLKSQAGRWDPNRQSWVQDDVNSPCIDAGDPNSDWTRELWPHGKCINMGAFGGTPQASMSLSDDGNIADLNNDDSVGYADMMLFTDKWLYQQVLLSEDLDRNGIVNFIDFAIFADNWP